MARYDNLSANLMWLRDPLAAFESFLEIEENGYNETELGKQFNDPSNPRNVASYLDYMFVWLAEGDGALWCPAYEDWLLAIIQFADDLYSPRDSFRTGTMVGSPHEPSHWHARTNTSLGLLDWGEISRDKVRNNQYVCAADAKPVRTPRPADEEGMRHPALDRNVYERCREQARERHLVRHLKPGGDN
jgi:hypothetical protein